jgi:hypothetical protein
LAFLKQIADFCFILNRKPTGCSQVLIDVIADLKAKDVPMGYLSFQVPLFLFYYSS